jgi:squalene cyclase
MGVSITTYKENDVVYDEDTSVFFVPRTGWKASTLKALKTVIDKAALEERKVARTALIIVSAYKQGDILETVTVTSLVAKTKYQDNVTEAWIKRANGERQKAWIYNLYPDTDETRAAFAKYLEAQAAARAATEAKDAARNAIPAFTAETLRADVADTTA